MNNALLFLFSFALGFVAAIPIGGSQIEIAKRVLSRNAWAAAMVIAGSIIPNALYGMVAVFGIAPFMAIPWVLAAFNAVGAALLIALGILTLRESRKPDGIDLTHASLGDNRRAFITGFSLALGSPSMLLMWIFGVALTVRTGLVSPITESASVLFISGGSLGLASYPSLLAAVMHRHAHAIPKHALGRVYFWLGVSLLFLSLYFLYGAAAYLVTGK